MYQFCLFMLGLSGGMSLTFAFAGHGLAAFVWWIACGAWVLAAGEWKPKDEE